jgi:hypothetical protein
MQRTLAVLLLAPAIWAQSADWKAGLAKTDISPGKPIPMWGYANRIAPFEKIETRIFAKALAIEDGEGHPAILITADLLGFPRDMAEAICQRIEKATGVRRASILLNGSHTHSAPALTTERFTVDSQLARIAEYTNEVIAKIADAAIEAWKNRKPARLSWGSGLVNFPMNRRQATARGIILGVNPRGPADRTVPVLRIEDASGVTRGVVFGAACHNTTLTGSQLNINGDYSGYAQMYLEAKLGAQAMFMAGCGADANPYPRAKLEYAQAHGKELSEEVGRVLGEQLKPVRGPVRTAFRRVALPLQQHSRAELDKMGAKAPTWLKFYVDGAKELAGQGKRVPETYAAPFAVWQFGQDLTLVGYSGETLVDYALLAEQRLGPLNLWVAGYCNDLFGYLPPARVLAEGGYETRGIYAGVGLFRPETEKVVMDAITALAVEAGRPGLRK